MSRVGKKPVLIPSGVEVKLDGKKIIAKGKTATLSYDIRGAVKVEVEAAKVNVIPLNPKNPTPDWGTTRAQIQALISGVHEGFKKELRISGVGYRASIQGKNLQLQLGFSHDVLFPIPESITIACPSQTVILISGANKQEVGEVAAKIRAYRGPEPYKGKGIKYADETIIRKEGKKK